MEHLKSRDHKLMIEGGSHRSERPKVPFWKRTPLPDDLFEYSVSDTLPVILNGTDGSGIQAIEIHPMREMSSKPHLRQYAHFIHSEGSHGKSLGKPFDDHVKQSTKDGTMYLVRKKGGDTPLLKLTFGFNENEKAHIDHSLIIVEPGAAADIVIDMMDPPGMRNRYFGRTTIVAMEGAQVRLVKVQRLSEGSQTYDMVLGHVEEGAVLEMVDIQIGAGLKALSREIELLGRHARAVAKVAYYGADTDRLDLAYTMSHGAPLTESQILGKGVLGGKASKVFRGNLFFKTGAYESQGREQEFVTLLSKEATSDSFPALMCSEDNVVGEHAASIGQVDTEKLFYLMSRGMTEVQAKRLILRASFEEVIGILEDMGETALYDTVVECLDSRFVEGEQVRSAGHEGSEGIA